MATHASNIQTYNVSPKRIIHIFIIMVINLKCYETENPYLKRCWITISKYGYHHTKPMSSKTLQQCKDHCEHQLPQCTLIVYDVLAGTMACSVKDNNDPFNRSFFESSQSTSTYLLDLQCSKNAPSCWTMKGDFKFDGLQRYGERNETLESCMNRCIRDFHNCDIINYAYPDLGGDGCYIKTVAGPLDKFAPMETMISFVLNRTCINPPAPRKSPIPVATKAATFSPIIDNTIKTKPATSEPPKRWYSKLFGFEDQISILLFFVMVLFISVLVVWMLITMTGGE